MNILVSIIIPTKNSAKTLGKCLEAIKEGTYLNIEVIVVDSGSSDKTLEIATRFGAKVFTYPEKRTLGQRAIGVKESSGQYILLLDSDQFLEKSIVERALQLINKGKVLFQPPKLYLFSS
ncbi:Glycosyltransferase GlyG [subsurface metagenome]